MTALERYVRLEATGLWQPGPDQPAQEVVVSFGATTLLICDLQDRPLSHWALAGIEAAPGSPGLHVFTTGDPDGERLSLRDVEMAEAIRAVSRASVADSTPARPRRGWRRLLSAALLVGVLGLALWQGPPLIADYAASMVPPEQSERIGDEMLLALSADGARICNQTQGVQALGALVSGLELAYRPRVRVLAFDRPARPVAILPGRYVVLDRRFVEAATGPEQLRAAILGAAQLRSERPAIRQVMDLAGTYAAFRYIFTGHIPDPILAEAARALTGPPNDAAPPVPWPLAADAPAGPAGSADPAAWAVIRAICAYPGGPASPLP